MSNLIDMSTLPVIKRFFTTRYGENINGDDDLWKLSDGSQILNIKYKRIRNDYLKYNLKLFLSFHAQRSSVSHTRNYYYTLVNLLEKVPPNKITEKSLKTMLKLEIKNRRGQKNEYTLWHLIDWYCWCADLGLPFFDESFALSIENITISGNLKGEAVRSLDKNQGPLDDVQLNRLLKKLSEDKDSENIEAKVLTWLCLVLGTNPRNLSLLLWKDFEVISNPGSEHKIFFIKVPRIKKRNEGNREEFKKRELDRRIGAVLLDYKGKDRNLNESMFNLLAGELSNKVVNYCRDKLSLDFHVNPRRLRYTFATRLVLSGVSKERLADLLDHTDLQHVQVYYDLRHKIKGFIDAAESKRLGEIFKQFEGNILRGKDANNVSHNLSFSYSNQKDKPVIGNCSSGDLCELNPPFSCFLCPKFNAFESSISTYKEILNYLANWSSKRLESFGENDRIHTLMKDVQLAIGDLINRIEKGGANG